MSNTDLITNIKDVLWKEVEFLMQCRKSIYIRKFLVYLETLNLKQLGRSQFDPYPSCGFPKNVCSKKRVKPWFSWLLIYHKSHMSWNFHWNFSSRSEDINNFSVNISYFYHFSSIFWIFWHFLVTKKLMGSANNRW